MHKTKPHLARERKKERGKRSEEEDRKQRCATLQ
jgi:hypothetical protein